MSAVGTEARIARSARDHSRDLAPFTIIDPATRFARYIPNINVLRANCEKHVMTSDNARTQEWAARQLYAMGCAPKLLTAAKYNRVELVSTSWLNPDCEIELRVNELQPATGADRAFVYPDGERVEDIRDACQAAWFAHDLDLIITIAQRYGLYWSALWPFEKARHP